VNNKKNQEEDINFVETSTSDFIEYYNKNIPKSFPRATAEVLEEFQAKFPSLFKGKSEWTINKHRKKLMDWLSSHQTSDKDIKS